MMADGELDKKNIKEQPVIKALTQQQRQQKMKNEGLKQDEDNDEYYDDEEDYNDQ